jgi:glutathione synthase/RimK-type ligase-like ATP-grasp enzyme
VTDVAVATTAVTDDPDFPALRDALARLGVTATERAWADPGARFDDVALTVIRSTWDYPMAHGAFLEWAARTPALHNPAAVVAWNSDKRYLDDLARRGVPTIATTYARRGDEAVLPGDDVVVKPTVAGGSRGAARFGPGQADDARAHVDAIRALGLEAMVQPFVESVATDGEVDVIVLDGAVSHAVVKHAPLGRAATDEPSGPIAVEPVVPTAAQLDVVARTLEAVPFDGPLCYARVDLVATDAGPCVIELEAIEPFLFLAEHPAAADRLAAAIVRRVGA